MIKAPAVLAILLVSCAALAQAPPSGSGLKPATRLEKVPAPAPEPAPAGPAPKTLEEIFACLSVGLPQDWRSATVEVIEIASDGRERQFEARYTYLRANEPGPVRLLPCDATSPGRNVHEFNEFLEPEKRQWKRAILTFKRDGKFDLTYDYTR